MRDDAPWWSGGLRFTCVGCGSCCGGGPGTVSFTDDERTAMASMLGVSEEEFDRLYVWRKYGRRSLRERANYDCILLDAETRRCTVYAARPSQCRTFPFWHDAVKSRRNWELYAEECPGMNSGELHDLEEISSILGDG